MQNAVIRAYPTNATNADSKDLRGVDMGQIAAVYELMPESADVPLDAIKGKIPAIIPEGIKLLDIKIEPIAFGLKKLVVEMIIDDSVDGIGTTLENALMALDGIENVENTSSALL